MASAATLRTARNHYRLSALTAQRASQQVLAARGRGFESVSRVVLTHQVLAAQQGERAVGDMLDEQSAAADPQARLNVLAFTTSTEVLARMVETADSDFRLGRLAASLVQDAGRAAESVSIAARPGVGYVRHLTPPSCSRCTVIAGRTYRFNEGFQRHPNCDCIHVAVGPGSDIEPIDPLAMAERGQVTGLSKDDMEALRDGADFGQVVNVRRKSAGLTEAGTVLTRAGRPTPAGIYRMAANQDEAIDLLARFGYVR